MGLAWFWVPPPLSLFPLEYLDMKYNIFMRTYSGTELVLTFECFAETRLEAYEVFNRLIRGTSGYYKAWVIDLEEDKELKYSSVLPDSIGE
jgi:hypothetical protein